MTIPIGSQVPDSTWQVLFEHRAFVPEGTKAISLSSCHGKVVVLVFVEIQG